MTKEGIELQELTSKGNKLYYKYKDKVKNENELMKILNDHLYNSNYSVQVISKLIGRFKSEKQAKE